MYQLALPTRACPAFQFRVLAYFGTALVGATVAAANYYGNLSYQAVSGTGTTLLMWCVPFIAALVAMYLVYICFSLCLCKQRGPKVYINWHRDAYKFVLKPCCAWCCPTLCCACCFPGDTAERGAASAPQAKGRSGSARRQVSREARVTV
jgi:hypothetical protein